MKTTAEYEAQVEKMIANARAWKESHPDAVVKIQYNYGIFFIAPISQAIENHFISCNEDGLAFIKAMWPWGSWDEPTANMCMWVLNSLKEGE